MTNQQKNKKSSLFNQVRLPICALAALIALGGCVSPYAGEKGLYAKPIGDAPVIANPTPYSAALVCLGEYAREKNLKQPRIAVGRVLDYTGKEDIQGGRQITQGASLMAISAFAKVGARLVERFDTSVSELELKYSNNKLIKDDPVEGQADQAFRRILAGQILGSEYYLVGGITELNYNIRSVGADAFVGDIQPEDPKGNGRFKAFVMNVGVDLRLVDTETLEVVDVVSYQKQIIGREIGGGVFSFWDDVVIDVGGGERALEPMQLAVRSLVERGILEMSANLYGVSGPEICAQAFGPSGDPLKPRNGVTGDFVAKSAAAKAALASNNAQTRALPERWHDQKDDAVKNALRTKQN